MGFQNLAVKSCVCLSAWFPQVLNGICGTPRTEAPLIQADEETSAWRWSLTRWVPQLVNCQPGPLTISSAKGVCRESRGPGS